MKRRKCPNCGRMVEILRNDKDARILRPHLYGAMLISCVNGGKPAPRPPK